MPRTQLFLAIAVAVLGAVPAAVVRGQDRTGPGVLSEVVVPGGLRAALAILDDRLPADRSQFLFEIIRRVHQNATAPGVPGNGPIQPLIDHLRAASRKQDSTTTLETIPLPLPAAVWREDVFGGRVEERDLVGAILQSRGASLLYCGLLSLDDETRAWLAGQPELVRDLAATHAAAFMLAAPGLRIAGARVHVPGGEAAAPIWEALAGRPATEPVAFVRALLLHDEGRLAYFYGSLAELTAQQIALALDLESPEASARVPSARRLYGVFQRLAIGWRIDARPFVRPPLDPALLVADLRADERGRPLLPGTQKFWNAAFGGGDSRTIDARALAEGERLELSWLGERIFDGEPFEQRRRYQQVLFASRVIARVEAATAREALDTVRAAAGYPALTATLERMKISDVAVYARAARRAAALSAIDEGTQGTRALAQFQGALALVARGASRGSLPADILGAEVTSLSAIELGERGDYDGRIVSWIDTHLRSRADTSARIDGAAGPVERDLIALLAGPASAELRTIEWEGTAYRLDLAHAEAARLVRLLGEEARPYLTSARALVAMADVLAGAGVTRQDLQRESAALDRIAQAVGWKDDDESWPAGSAIDRYREIVAALERVTRGGNAGGAARLAPALRVLADDLLAHGLIELVYATALGQADRAWFRAADAAVGHDFGLRFGGVSRRDMPWRFATTGGEGGGDRYALGSLLGLDVRLAPFSLVRLSSKPPPRRPTLHEEHRRVLVEGVALVEWRALTDADREALVSAMRKGRERLAGVRTPLEATALADEAGLGPVQRSLLPWVVAHERERLGVFLSPSELVWLGLGGRPVAAAWQAWGVPGESRLGCLCLQLVDRRPWDTFAGRWGTGIFMSAFPDLNLRLAELMTELGMPAPLQAPVLSAATLDFVNGVDSRDQDDRRALVELVRALNVERVEQYLALLTTDGPLVPTDSAASTDATKTGVPR